MAAGLTASSVLPLDPGHDTVVLAPLSETARAAFWRRALDRAGIACRDVDALAARWRIGPGVVHDVVSQAATRRGADPDATLDAVARQHRRPRFRDPAGRLVAAIPARDTSPELGWPQIRAANEPLAIDADTIACEWDGSPVDYGRVIDELVVVDGLT